MGNNGIYRQVDTVLFDLDGTLRHNKPDYTQAFFDYAVRLGVPDGDEKRRATARWTHYYWAQSGELAQDSERFNVQGDPFWINYLQRSLVVFGCTEDCAVELAPELSQCLQKYHHFEDYVPTDVPEVLKYLKGAGYRLGVLSNRSNPYREYLLELGLADYFELILAAGEVDIWKPDAKIFQIGVDRLQTTPAKTVYVGDNYYADIIGSRNAGLSPILIDPEGVFPDADCPVITTLGELQNLLSPD